MPRDQIPILTDEFHYRPECVSPPLGALLIRRGVPFRPNLSQLPFPYFLQDHPVEWEIRDKLA
jgi:hypothetical protein